MGVEMIKDRFGEDQLVLSNEDFYNDDVMGNSFTNYDIMKVIKSNSTRYKFVAKVVSKKNSKIYVLKQLNNYDQIDLKFQKLKSINHSNIIKYFKWFNDNGNVYVVKEYVDNGGLSNLVEAYSSIQKPIEENTLWNIFMQCMAGLDYLHINGIIHNKLTLNNILMNENKVIKLDDIQIQINQDQSSKINDIRDMGKIFEELMTISNQNTYPNEMKNIVNTMVNNYSSQNSTQLFNLIMEQYIKNVAKVTSINSIFRCMFSFRDFAERIYNSQNVYQQENTPVAYYYKLCQDNYIQNGQPNDIKIIYNYFRNLLYRNSQMNNDVEIRPRQVLEFLLERLNKETGTNFRGSAFGTQLMIFKEKKEEALKEFQQYFNNNFNSIISQLFVGYIKTKRICNKCNSAYYSFNIHPFIEFDMEMSKIPKDDPMNLLENWFKAQNNQKKVLSVEHKIVCRKCGVTEHREFKQFYVMPKCFIISLNRGKSYTNNYQINIPMVLNLKDKIEIENSYNIYNLVGIVKRMTDEKQDEYFIAIYFDHCHNTWVISDRNSVSTISNPLAHTDGLVVLLFYYANNQFGQ